MAIDYTGTNSGIFSRLGKFIKYIDAHAGDAAALDAELKAIADKFELSDLTNQIVGLYGDYAGFKDNITSVRQQLASYSDAIFTDRDTVLEQLNMTTADAVTVLVELHRQMVIDAQTINRSVVSVGSVTPTAGITNAGNGTVLLTTILDGVTSPLAGGPAIRQYAGQASELVVPSETMTFECTLDSSTGTAGSEQFGWTGEEPDVAFGWQDDGSGPGPQLTASAGASVLTNGNFESWTSPTVPASWTIDAGGTLIAQETVNVYRGTSSLKITGDGATAVQISQPLSVNQLQPRRMYCLALRIKASAVPAAGVFQVLFTGTGYSGTVLTREIQDVQIAGTPAGGTYTLTLTGPFGGTQTTGTIAFNAASSAVQTAIRALPGFETVSVATQAGSPPNVTHRITFYNVNGGMPLVVANIGGLTGGSPTQTVTRVQAGIAGDAITLAAAGFPTNWQLVYLFFLCPASIPSDLKLVLATTAALSAGTIVYIDAIDLAAVTYHGGLGAVVVPGSTPFTVGDRFTSLVTNSEAVIQRFFRRRYQLQLPSSGSPTVADALAT